MWLERVACVASLHLPYALLMGSQIDSVWHARAIHMAKLRQQKEGLDEQCVLVFLPCYA